MGNLGSFIQILVFVLVIAGPAIGAVARKLKAHAEAKRAEADRNRQKIESIRTGRSDASGQTAAGTRTQTDDQSRRSRLEQLARQRQAQIEELRRRAAQRRAQAGAPSGGQSGGQSAGSPRSQPQASRPTQSRSQHNQPRPDGSQQRPPVQARSAAQSSGGRSQMPGSTPVPQQSAPREAIEARRRAEIARRRAEIQARKEQAARNAAAQRAAAKANPAKPVRSALRVSAEPEPVARAPRPKIAAQPIVQSLRDPAGLRNAIVLTEILGPPVGLRQPGSGPADDPASI